LRKDKISLIITEMKILKESKKPAERKNPEETPWGRVFLLVGAGVVASFQIGKVPPVFPGSGSTCR